MSVCQIRSLRTTLAFCPVLREHVLSLLLTSKTKGNKLTTFLVQKFRLKDYTKQKTAFIHKRMNGKMKVAKMKQLRCSCHYVYTCLLLHLNLHIYIHLLCVLFPGLSTSVNNKSPTVIITITELQLTFITTWDSSF